jgi:hypothetical protein
MNYGWEVNTEAWAQSRAPGASFANVGKEVGASAITEKERSLIQAAEDKIGVLTKEYLVLSDPKNFEDRIEAARAIEDPPQKVETLTNIHRDKAALPEVLAELDRAIVVQIRLMYPSAIRLIEACIKRIDIELAKINLEQTKVDEFWGLKTVESSNWLVFGIQRLRSGLESNLTSLRTGDPNQVSICRYVLHEAGLFQAKAKVQSP